MDVGQENIQIPEKELLITSNELILAPLLANS